MSASETTATAPAAIATIPAVLVRSCTRDRIGTDARDAATRPATPVRAARLLERDREVSVLLAVFFSPGTGSTVAVTV